MHSIRGNLAIILAALCLAGIPAVSYYHHSQQAASSVKAPEYRSMPPSPDRFGNPGPWRGRSWTSPEAFRERFGTAENFADHYIARDADGDGLLDASEMSERLAARLLPVTDTDEDGLISRDELVAYATGRLDGTIASPFAPAPGNAPAPGHAPAAGNAPVAENLAGGVREGGRRLRPAAAAGAPPPSVPEPSVDEMTFAEHMQQAQSALDVLGKSALDSGSRQNDVLQARAVQHALIHAKAKSDTIPMAPQAKSVYGDDYDAYLRGLQKQLITAIGHSLDLEAALLADDADAARSAAEQLLASQREGHRLFREKRGEVEGD